MTERPLPAEPTDAPAGSPQKLAVLRLRWVRREALWHPADATAVLPPPTPTPRGSRTPRHLIALLKAREAERA